MIKIGIAGFGKIGKLRFEELKKNKGSKVISVYDVKKPKNNDNRILNVLFGLVNFVGMLGPSIC